MYFKVVLSILLVVILVLAGWYTHSLNERLSQAHDATEQAQGALDSLQGEYDSFKEDSDDHISTLQGMVDSYATVNADAMAQADRRETLIQSLKEDNEELRSNLAAVEYIPPVPPPPIVAEHPAYVALLKENQLLRALDQSNAMIQSEQGEEIKTLRGVIDRMGKQLTAQQSIIESQRGVISLGETRYEASLKVSQKLREELSLARRASFWNSWRGKALTAGVAVGSFKLGEAYGSQ